jgi:2-dehydropantoate 2-reductase
MGECRRVAQSLQIEIPESMIERRLNVAGSAAGHKMYMLYDLQRGRSLELDALVAAVQELGKLTATPVPALDILLALAQKRGRQAGLHLQIRFPRSVCFGPRAAKSSRQRSLRITMST